MLRKQQPFLLDLFSRIKNVVGKIEMNSCGTYGKFAKTATKTTLLLLFALMARICVGH